MKRRYAVWVRAAFGILCVGFLASCATVGPKPTGGSASLDYTLMKEPGEFSYMVSGTVGLEEQASGQLDEEPVYFSKNPRYGQLQLASGKSFAVVWDESQGTGSGYDTFYADLNGNGNLTDDDPIVALSERQPGEEEFRLAEFAVPCEDGTRPYHVRFRRCGDNLGHVHTSMPGYCEGSLNLNGTTYRVALFDDTQNAAFNDATVKMDRSSGNLYTRGDVLLIDLDGDGELNKSYTFAPEMFRLGSTIVLDGVCYDINVTPSGERITLAPTEAELGTVKPNDDSLVAELLGSAGALRVNGTTKVPADEYLLSMCSIEAKDDRGKLWRLVGRGQIEQDPLTVKAGKRAKLSLGAPLTASVKAEEQGSDNYRLNVTLAGQGGEIYSVRDLHPDDTSDQPPAPTLKIHDASGNLITQASFQYG